MPAVKKFKIEYSDGQGHRVREMPRIMVSADGAEKALIIGEGSVIATVAMDAPDEELWQKGRQNIMRRT